MKVWGMGFLAREGVPSPRPPRILPRVPPRVPLYRENDDVCLDYNP